MTIGLLLFILLAVFGIWYFLDRREKARLARGLPRHSGLRLIFASFAILTVLFSGGCGGLFLFSWIADGMSRNNYIGWEIIAVLSLPPLLVGVLVWWLAMRRKGESENV